MKIDSHHHFWKYSPAEYPWIGYAMGGLRRDFLPEHLQRESEAAGIDGVVSVQARQSVAETDWLLSLAEANPFIKAVVGWVPLAAADVRDVLARIAPRSKLRAVRHVVQDEADDRFILGTDFNRGVALLREFGLAYNILIFERQLAATIEFVDRHPGQIFVLDHIAKPRIRDHVMEPWGARIREVARRSNVYCKVSGMTTEAEWGKWKEEDLRPYFDVALEAFGPKRLMFGSDWPVSLAAGGYLRWVEVVRKFGAQMSQEEQDWLFGETAAQAYGLK